MFHLYHPKESSYLPEYQITPKTNLSTHPPSEINITRDSIGIYLDICSIIYEHLFYFGCHYTDFEIICQYGFLK